VAQDVSGLGLTLQLGSERHLGLDVNVADRCLARHVLGDVLNWRLNHKLRRLLLLMWHRGLILVQFKELHLALLITLNQGVSKSYLPSHFISLFITPG
jgi:hypothetical protein